MNAEAVLFWSATFAYAIATLALTGGVVARNNKWLTAGFVTGVAAFALQTGSVVLRWWASGRLPYVGDYENVLAGTWFIMLLYIALAWWKPNLRLTGLVVLPFILLTLGYAMTIDRGVSPTTPPFKSIWLGVHVLFAWATYAAYTASAALAVIELMKSRKRGPKPGSLLERTPEVPALQETTFRLVTFGFAVNGVMIASGAIWAYELWGAYWSWDPVETWSLLTWLAFGFYMHARLTLGWKGKRLAYLTLFALFGVFMTFWGVQFAPSILGSQYHIFENMGELMGGSSRVR